MAMCHSSWDEYSYDSGPQEKARIKKIIQAELDGLAFDGPMQYTIGAESLLKRILEEIG